MARFIIYWAVLMGSEIDPDFEITDALRRWAYHNVPELDIDKETGRFIDHWLSTGEKKKSWEATWRNWMRRAPQMGGYMKTARRKPEEISEEQRKEDADKAVADMERYRRMQEK